MAVVEWLVIGLVWIAIDPQRIALVGFVAACVIARTVWDCRPGKLVDDDGD